ncbi:sigma-70 family RNA polymerase sigma factor [Actinocrispum wychmicini]|uniref:RNA polymerase sigma factor (Sigma-70 family) n=1 Tax=Actinocrispum wychmicini TaxID=1213861 RepID=A0A4R2JVV9_9PSEU|nr:sigma-70 family RNA polymerase sigma factor [Actinocrispum wychmicini]TCO64573.1 RNA polymerase sigma factor (sigma-70 family) [Actinocrispum wychmicini]
MTATGNPALNTGEESLQDRELLAVLRAGEDAAFGELFSRHADAVRRLARSLSADRADAEDLTAEAFFRVLQAIRRGSGPNDNVRSYLLIVTRRVAWEWRERRRDVPVSDEVLSHRAGQNPDTTGQAHERNLIARAFSSLPERWRSVLWKVEVEGERPAVVATNFGLSPNATAALARRARRGLRAAYLQAHLSTHQGSTACRAILEKLGAYTAGTIKGAERRRVRAHLVTCSSCQSTHDELVDVCAGLRSYAGVMAAPILAGGLLAANKTGVLTMVKGLLSGAGAKLTIAASSVLAVGVFGVVSGSSGGSSPAALDFSGRGELVISGSSLTRPLPVTGSLSTSMPATGRVLRAGENGAKDEPRQAAELTDAGGPNAPLPEAEPPSSQQEVAVAFAGSEIPSRQDSVRGFSAPPPTGGPTVNEGGGPTVQDTPCVGPLPPPAPPHPPDTDSTPPSSTDKTPASEEPAVNEPTTTSGSTSTKPSTTVTKPPKR